MSTGLTTYHECTSNVFVLLSVLSLYTTHTNLAICLIHMRGQWHINRDRTYKVVMFVVVNLDALAQASDFSKGDKLSSSVEYKLRNQGLWNWISTRLNARWQTSNWAIEDVAKNELNNPSLWSASIQPTRPLCRLPFTPGSGDIHVCCCFLRWSGTGKRFSNRKETSCLSLLNAPGSLEPNLHQTECPLTNRLSYRGSS